MSDEPKPAGNRGKGRKKGVPNKNTALLKDMILTALEEANPEGGVGYLKKQALEQPVAFMALIGKVLPTQVTGEGGGPLAVVTEITLVGVRAGDEG